MPIYEDKGFLRSLHLEYLKQDDLPGSDAPKNPPQPPTAKATKTKKKTSAPQKGRNKRKKK
jgi:hypothetical protein